MDKWIMSFRNAESAEGKPAVLIPGDIEREYEEQARRRGIALIPAVTEELNRIAADLGMEIRL